MINQNLQADNQGARAELPEGEKAGRVNIPAGGTHKPGSTRALKAAYSAKVQKQRAAKAAAAFPDLNDDIARVFVSNMLTQFDRAPADAEAFEKCFNESAALPGAFKLAEEMERRIDEAVKASGETGRRAEHLRFILRFYATLAPFMARDRIRAKLAGEDGKPTPKRRGAGKKKAAPGTLPAYIPDFFAMMNREELAAIPQMIRTNPTRGAKISGLRAVVFEAEGVKLFQETGGAADLAGLAPDVALDQLLKMAVIGLTRNNHITDGAPKNPDALNLDINFSLADYARLKGYDMDIKPDKDPATEKRRISRIMQHVRKEAEEEGDRIMGAHLTFKRKGKNGAGTFEIYNIFAKFHIDDNNAVKCTFIKEAAAKILDAPLTWIPAALFRLNGNHPNAYKVACKADAYYFMDPNYGKPKAHILLVKTLLGYTDIKTPEEWEAQGQAWTCSRTAFERQLNKLKAEGFITGWRYCGVNGAELTPAEIDAIRTDKTKWQKARIWLDFPPLPADQGARIERKEKKRAERQKRKEKSELEAMKKDVSNLKKYTYHRKKQDGNQ